MNDKLIIIGANEFQDQLVLKANEMGYETHVFAWEDGAVAKKHADYFYPISITDKEKILEIAKKINPAGVVSIASDLAVITVNYIAEKLGLVCNGMESAIKSTNKYEMRQAFYKNSVHCPKSIKIDNLKSVNPEDFQYPVIVKPVDRSGSRGIFKVDLPDKLIPSILDSKMQSFKKEVLIEEYACGKEYSVEMISYKGEHFFLAITEKFTTGSPNFIETMHLQPAILTEEVKQKIILESKNALNALGIVNGASHTELKIDENNNIKIIEVGARMGGDCIGSDLVKLSTGYDFVKMVIEVAVGKKPDFNEVSQHKKVSFVKFIFNKKDLDILNEINIHNKDNLVRYEILGEIGSREIKDSSTRFGFYILDGNSRNEMLNFVNYKVNNND